MKNRLWTVMRLGVFSLCAVASLVSSGCGGSEPAPDLFPVTGKVMYGGKPVPGAEIVFVSVEEEDPKKKNTTAAKERPHAKTDSEGAYELMWVEESGAPAGKYNVMIVAFEPLREGEEDDPETGRPSLIPLKYNNPKQSKLSAVVKEIPDNEINFPLDD